MSTLRLSDSDSQKTTSEYASEIVKKIKNGIGGNVHVNIIIIIIIFCNH